MSDGRDEAIDFGRPKAKRVATNVARMTSQRRRGAKLPVCGLTGTSLVVTFCASMKGAGWLQR